MEAVDKHTQLDLGETSSNEKIVSFNIAKWADPKPAFHTWNN